MSEAEETRDALATLQRVGQRLVKVREREREINSAECRFANERNALQKERALLQAEGAKASETLGLVGGR